LRIRPGITATIKGSGCLGRISSADTIKRYYKEYHIRYQGEDLCIEAHIRQGNGSANECLRIYVVQPRKPGDPVIIGQIGAHLPIDGRSH
jgi:hypothetical protein